MIILIFRLIISCCHYIAVDLAIFSSTAFLNAGSFAYLGSFIASMTCAELSNISDAVSILSPLIIDCGCSALIPALDAIPCTANLTCSILPVSKVSLKAFCSASLKLVLANSISLE